MKKSHPVNLISCNQMRPFTAMGGAAEKATLEGKLNQRVLSETSDMDSVFCRGSKANTKAS